MFQYIGELCRYLVAAPPCPAERTHRLRLACGNGLSAERRRAFAARFGAPQVLEFYASTEGNVTLYNVEGKVGAIGRVPSFLAARDAIALARFDFDAEAPWRGPDGILRPLRGRRDRRGARADRRRALAALRGLHA